jgi:hypothetical protein
MSVVLTVAFALSNTRVILDFSTLEVLNFIGFFSQRVRHVGGAAAVVALLTRAQVIGLRLLLIDVFH